MPENATFSSALTRERDKAIEDKHRREILALERKIDNLRRTNDDTRKQLFDVVHRAERLAQNMGYDCVFEAQEALDMMESGFNFKMCVHRLQELEKTAEEAKAEVDSYSQRLQEAAGDLKECRERQKEELQKSALLARDYDHLKDQYASLELKFTRAADRYKLDYKKWRDFQQYLTGEDKRHRMLRNQEGVTPAEQDRLEAQSIKRKLEYLQNLGPNLQPFEDEEDGVPPPMGGTELPEHLATPQLRPSDMAHLSSSSSASRTLVQHPIDRIKRQYAMPSLSPTIFSTANNATSRKDDADTAYSSETEPASPFSSSPCKSPPNVRVPAFKLPGLPLSKLKAKAPAAEGNSSETEEESQCTSSLQAAQPQLGTARSQLSSAPPSASIRFAFKRPLTSARLSSAVDSQCTPIQKKVLAKPHTQSKLCEVDVAPSSETEDDSQASTTETTPLRGQAEALTSSVAANARRRPADFQPNSERPVKIRRVSGAEFGGADVSTPRGHDENVRPGRGRERLPRTEPVKTSKPGRPAQKKKAEASSAAGPTTLDDYSIFKGKGRYSKKAEAGPSTSINSRYVINAEKNGGRDYQFDEVVRSREARKKMDAGDCECCKDYYRAVGPLPNRLQAPLWRSPSTTPTKVCRRLHGSNVEESPSAPRRQDIEAHKKGISRHRFHWERAKTPPDYWNIGFPSTQEVGHINERAAKMHQQKVREIEKGAESGSGKYQRR